MAYKEKLGNVDATLNTTDKLMRIADPKRLLNTILTLLIVIALTLILIAVLKKVLGNSAESFWEFLSKPFKNLSERWKAADRVREEVMRTGRTVSITLDEAKEIADMLDGCVTSLGFGLVVNDHDVRDILLSRVKNAPNYRLVEGQFGTRTHKGLLGKSFSFRLKDFTNKDVMTPVYNANLIKNTLIAIGVTKL